MNIKDQHLQDKAVSAVPIFKSELGTATAIQIQAGEQLKEHITKIPAMLMCISGTARFENELGIVTTLHPGDYIHIEPMVKHWVDGETLCDLVLVK